MVPAALEAGDHPSAKSNTVVFGQSADLSLVRKRMRFQFS